MSRLPTFKEYQRQLERMLDEHDAYDGDDVSPMQLRRRLGLAVTARLHGRAMRYRERLAAMGPGGRGRRLNTVERGNAR